MISDTPGRGGEGGVKKGQIFADVLYGWPQNKLSQFDHKILISTFLKLNFCLLLINLWENHTLPKRYRIGRASRSSKPLENAGYPMGLKIWQVYQFPNTNNNIARAPS